MGLRQARSLWPVGLVTVVVIVLGLFGDAGRELLAYTRVGLAGGDLWRLLTGHFVHLNPAHAALNLVGLWLVWYLVAAEFRSMEWLFVTLVAIISINSGFWFFEPQLSWYVGLSGVLHGLLAAGVVPGMRRRKIESFILAGVLLVKIGFEQLVGPMPGSEATAGGAVIVAAHFYGALGGLVAGGLMLIRVREKASI